MNLAFWLHSALYQVLETVLGKPKILAVVLQDPQKLMICLGNWIHPGANLLRLAAAN